MTSSLTRWLRREPVAAGRHVRVMASTTVPGAAPALVAAATQVVIAADGEQAPPPADPAEPAAPAAEQVATESPLPEPEPAHVVPDADEPEPAAWSGAQPETGHHAAEPVVAPVEQQQSAPTAAAAVEPPPFEPPPWDLPAPAAPPVPATEPVPSSSPFGGRYEPHPVALEFSDGARFELDEDDPRFESFLAAAAAVTGAAHDTV